MSDVITSAQQKMQKSLEILKNDLSGLRAGRATTSLLDTIRVSSYGSEMPINQVANVSVPEARTLSVQVWDSNMIQAVEKGILDSDLGLNPIVAGNIIRIPLPDLTEERRIELKKIAHKYAEKSRVSIRNHRREAMDKLKQMEKNKEISEDQYYNLCEEVQEATDERIKKVEQLLSKKEQDIITV